MPEEKNILINQRFINNQPNIDSKLVLTDDYYSYQQTSLGGGVTTEFNVRQFLANANNDQIGDDFFNFLTANTSIQEFKNIFNSDDKLSNIFNTYYEKSVVGSQASSRSFVEVELTGTTTFNVYTNNRFDWNSSIAIDPFGNKMQGEIDSFISSERKTLNPVDSAVLASISTEESYYIPIHLARSNTQTALINFSSLVQDCYEEVEQSDGTFERVLLRQCFVNTNKSLSSNINDLYTNSSINDISFKDTTVSINEGSTFDVVVNLSQPSSTGLEEISITVDEEKTTANDNDYDFLVDGFPTTDKTVSFTFSPGETTKTFTVRAKSDFILDDSNSLFLKFTNDFNVEVQNNDEMEIQIINTTVISDMEMLPSLRTLTYGERAGGVSPTPSGILTVFSTIQPSDNFVNSIGITQVSITRNQVNFPPPLAFGVKKATFNNDTSYGNSVYTNYDEDNNTFIAPRNMTINVNFNGSLGTASPSFGAGRGAVKIMKINTSGEISEVATNKVTTVTTGKNASTITDYPLFIKVNPRNNSSPYFLDFNVDGQVNLSKGDKVFFEFGGSVPHAKNVAANAVGGVVNIWMSSGRFDVTSIEGGEVRRSVDYVSQSANEVLNIPVRLSLESTAGFEVGKFSISELDFDKSTNINNIVISTNNLNFGVGESLKNISLSARESNLSFGQSVYRFNFDSADRSVPIGIRSFDIIVTRN